MVTGGNRQATTGRGCGRAAAACCGRAVMCAYTVWGNAGSCVLCVAGPQQTVAGVLQTQHIVVGQGQ